jgi:glycosyltransferase involved in cell wall biosynthesis
MLEAAACGLPVIARDSYAPETVIHGRTGYLASSEREIFDYLEVLIANSDLRQELGCAGRAHSRNYDWDSVTVKWERVFTQLAEANALRRAS